MSRFSPDVCLAADVSLLFRQLDEGGNGRGGIWTETAQGHARRGLKDAVAGSDRAGQTRDDLSDLLGPRHDSTESIRGRPRKVLSFVTGPGAVLADWIRKDAKQSGNRVFCFGPEPAQKIRDRQLDLPIAALQAYDQIRHAFRRDCGWKDVCVQDLKSPGADGLVRVMLRQFHQ